MKKAMFFIAWLLACAGNSIIAQIINVPADQPTIQAAIDAANEGDTVLVAEGTYYENIDFKSKAITVASHYLIDNDEPGDTLIIKNTIIDGSQPVNLEKGSVVTIMNVANSKASLIGFTITGGSGSLVAGFGTKVYGGGVLIVNNGAIIRDNYIINNLVDEKMGSGGGLVAGLSENAELIIQNNKIAKNEVIAQQDLSAGAGLAIIASKNSTITIRDNHITHNKATLNQDYGLKGGGIYLETEYSYGADIQIYNNVINHNEVNCERAAAAGVYVVFNRNAPLPTTTAQVKIFNNLIHDNYSQDRGSGIVVWNMTYKTIGEQTPLDPLIYNNTIVNNHATEGAGLMVIDAKIGLFNNILHNNGSVTINDADEIYFDTKDYPDWIHTNWAVIYGEHNNIKGGWEASAEIALTKDWVGEWYGDNNLNSEPMLDSESFELAALSECVGNGATGITIDGESYLTNGSDLHDTPRPHTVDEFVDIGAIESAHPRVVTGIDATYPSFGVYPIPVNNTLFLTLKKGIEQDLRALEIISSNGRLISGVPYRLDGRAIRLDISKITTGVYILKIHSSRGIESLRFVKE